MTEALSWWIAATVLGLLAFPIAFVFLTGLPDRGYAFSKILGLLLVSYAFWIAGTTGVLPIERWSIVVLIVILDGAASVLAWRRWDELFSFLRGHVPYILAVEALFAAAFGVSLWLRSHVADINNVEAPMDFAMLNTVVRADSFPPLDPWLAGETVNYHYFGFLKTGLLTTLTGVSPGVAYNLGLALFIGLAFSAGFGLMYNVAARYRPARLMWGRLNAGAVGLGLLAVVLLFVFSNFEGVFEMLAAHGLGPQGLYDLVDITGLDGPKESHAWYPTEHDWWYRAIVYWGTWTEFPFFTFQLGNLHPNFMSVPTSLLAFGLAWNLLAGDGAPLRGPGRHPLHLVLTALVLGSLLFINGWSFPPAATFVLVFAALKLHQIEGGLGRREIAALIVYAATIGAIVLAAYAPFIFTTHLPLHIHRATGPIVEPMDLFMMWGLFLIVIFFLALFAIARHPRGWRFSWPQLAAAAVLGTLPVILWPASRLLVETRNLPDLPYRDATGWWTVFILTSLLTLVTLAIVRQLPLGRGDGDRLPLVFSLGAAAVGLLLILGPELYVVVDPIEQRINTINKSWFQAWFLLAIGVSFALYWILQTWRPGVSFRIARPAWAGLALLLVAAGLVYPVAVTYSRTYNFAGVRPTDGVARTIDGVAFMKVHRPEELQALQWIDANVDGQPVILEAVCCSWIGFSDVSAYTGLVTVLGWPTHEFQWRGDWDAFANPENERLKDVERAYVGTMAEARAVIDKYDVEYVYVGRTEREFYLTLDGSPLQRFPKRIDKFQRFMDVVFENALVTIYRVRGPSPAATVP